MNSENEPDTLVLVGSGAVCLTPEGIAYFDELANEEKVLTEFIGKSTTWRVFFHAMTKSKNNVFKNKNNWDLSDDPVEFYYNRFKIAYSKYKSIRQYAVNLFCSDMPDRNKVADLIDKFSEFRKPLIDEISKLFNDCSQLIKLNISGSSSTFLPSFVIPSAIFCTTNWDRALENFFTEKDIPGLSDKNVFHIHGHFREVESLLLPLDSTYEDLILSNAIVKKNLKHERTRVLADKLFGVLRPWRNIESLARSHGKIFEGEDKRWKRIVIWGLSLNSEDLELFSILDSLFSEVIQRSEFMELIIINPDARHRDRIARLLGVPAEKRIDIDPTVPCKTTFKL